MKKTTFFNGGIDLDIKMLTVKLEGNKVESLGHTKKIRGYLAGRFPQYLELHNHMGEDKFSYGYPVIQYKSIGGVPNIILPSMRLQKY